MKKKQKRTTASRNASAKPRRRRAASLKPAPTAAPLSLAAEEVSTQDYVYQCIQDAAPGAQFDDASVLNNIPVNGDDVGLCLNNRIPLRPARRWRAGEIRGDWTVAVLTARTEYRRRN